MEQIEGYMKLNYDLSKKVNYLNRKMFLDPAGPVTVQRFEEVAYPRIQRFAEIAEGFFWRPQEINLQKDKIDMREASDAVKFIFTENLLRQTTLDSFQGRGVSQIFTPVVSVPELEDLVTNWSFFETSIHSKSYSHIVRGIYNVPKEEFNKIHDNQAVINMASSIGKYYDELHLINCQKEAGLPVDEHAHLKAVWLALNASYGLEALRFMVSFATSLAMVENKLFMGNGNIISLILQDELLHTEWTGYLINQNVKDDERFRALKAECAAEVYAMFMDVIREEKAWADHLFKMGVVIGLNANILKSFVDFTAHERLKAIGIKYTEDSPKSNPIPWFGKHSNTSKKQTALQENESVNYVIGAVTEEVDYNDLPDIE
jgi:ribonucleoside-diphosphate reductase beta chain